MPKGVIPIYSDMQSNQAPPVPYPPFPIPRSLSPVPYSPQANEMYLTKLHRAIVLQYPTSELILFEAYLAKHGH